jgi:hypothetical protein
VSALLDEQAKASDASQSDALSKATNSSSKNRRHSVTNVDHEQIRKEIAAAQAEALESASTPSLQKSKSRIKIHVVLALELVRVHSLAHDGMCIGDDCRHIHSQQ